LENISHAYIFLGIDDEITKEAIKLAQLANCENRELTPCGFCTSCRKVQNGVHPDVIHIYPEGSYIKIEQIRNLILDSAEKPVEGIQKVYIIHQAHTMTPQAQNSLLKTLEDPIADSIVILLANNLKQLIPTVISRCQIRDYSQEEKPSLSINTRERIADILLRRLQSTKMWELSELVRELSDSIENPEEILEFIISLYRDVLLAKTNSNVAFINQDLQHIIDRLASLLTVNATVQSLDFVRKQLMAVRSRGNKNLILFNLLMGLEEVD